VIVYAGTSTLPAAARSILPCAFRRSTGLIVRMNILTMHTDEDPRHDHSGPEMHARAKRAARARRTTVSGLIETFLRSPQAAGKDVSLVDEMLGSGQLRAVKRARDALYDALHERTSPAAR